MLAKRVIPCLDVDKGRVVKGVRFKGIRDVGDPVEQARIYDAQGADELVFYDITASAESRRIMLDIVRHTAEQVFIPFTVGGGLRSVDDMREVLLAGADKVSVNTAAVQKPEIIRAGADQFGSQCIVLSIDALRHDEEKRTWWEVYINGGRTPTGMDAIEWARKGEELGAGEYVLNSIDADGTRAGYDVELTRRISEGTNLPVIASGGAGGVEHMVAVLKEGKADAVLAASIFHFGEMTVGDVKRELAKQGIVVRL